MAFHVSVSAVKGLISQYAALPFQPSPMRVLVTQPPRSYRWPCTAVNMWRVAWLNWTNWSRTTWDLSSSSSSSSLAWHAAIPCLNSLDEKESVCVCVCMCVCLCVCECYNGTEKTLGPSDARHSGVSFWAARQWWYKILLLGSAVFVPHSS